MFLDYLEQTALDLQHKKASSQRRIRKIRFRETDLEENDPKSKTKSKKGDFEAEFGTKLEGFQQEKITRQKLENEREEKRREEKKT